MKKVRGFLEHARVPDNYEPPQRRVEHSGEFLLRLSDDQARQQAVRCMDCGIPFCSNGCPVHNVIPDFNDLVYRDDWKKAIDLLHETNNFPEFTGRVCPAPCEAACTLNLNREAVGIKSIERAIVDRAWEMNWIVPEPAAAKTGRRVAVVGSGPAGLACAQQLARAGHGVTVFEKSDEVGGLLRYGIPDFKLEKWIVQRRVEQLAAEGVEFKTRVSVGQVSPAPGWSNMANDGVSADELLGSFDAVVLAVGSEAPRDLAVPGRELGGIHFAMDYLVQHNRRVAGLESDAPILATGKHVVVIGGGDTGADCVGTANRQGAESILQIELLSRPPETEDKAMTWPNWPNRLRTSSSHEEGCEREWGIKTLSFEGRQRVERLRAVRIGWEAGALRDIPGGEFDVKADLVLIAMGFAHPQEGLLEEFGVHRDARGNARGNRYQSANPKVFVAGDAHRGQSLVVWAIREGRACALSVSRWLAAAV